MRRALSVALVVGLVVPAFSLPATGQSTSDLAREIDSPPGQIIVVTVNARQPKVLGLQRFGSLLTLVTTLRTRPDAFDGGVRGAVTAPDVIVMQEITLANLEIFQKLLNQRSDYNYEPAVAEGSRPKFLFNSDTVTLLGAPTAWLDPCRTGTDGQPMGLYQHARFVEKTSNLGFTVAGVHLLPRYPASPNQKCRAGNVAELHRQMLTETGPVVVGGDFNYRPVVEFRECDPDERSEPSEWWALMTSSLDGESGFVDAVQHVQRRRKASMEHQWTHEQPVRTMTCAKTKQHRRSRIDYLFSRGAVVAEAHADHPGWAGDLPGTRHPRLKRYSDHRFVWGRFILGGPPRPRAPRSVPAKGGVIDLSWSPMEEATGYVLYRAEAGKAAYSVVARVGPTSSTYSDSRTKHGVTYRYALAAIGGSGAQGFESRPARAGADAQGPQVTRVTPSSGATRVAPNKTITVRFGERIDLASMGPDTIELVQKARTMRGRDKRIRGRIKIVSGRLLNFDPATRLDRKRSFVVIVRAVADQLGNRGRYFSSRFST